MGVFWKSLTLFLLYAQCSYGFIDLGGHLKRMILNDGVHPEIIYNFTAKSVKSCPEFEQQLQDVHNETQVCFAAYKTEEISVCRFMTENFRKCMHPYNAVLEACLPSDIRDVPGFLIDSFMSFTNFVCSAKGKIFLELSNPCLRRQSSYEGDCMDKISDEIDHFKETFPTKSQICHFIGEARTCLKTQLQGSCDSPATRNTVLSVYDAVSAECKNAQPYVKVNEVLDRETH